MSDDADTLGLYWSLSMLALLISPAGIAWLCNRLTKRRNRWLPKPAADDRDSIQTFRRTLGDRT